MKLSLAEAMLRKADILMLDEPTNHLDVGNVAWLENYLNGLHNVTCMIVSHDSGFLDNVATNIIHYENRKLVTYKGNLSEFIKCKPEAKSYYDLGAVVDEWTLPNPGFLDGVKTKGKAIVKMTNVSFQYPGSEKKQIDNVTLGVSLGSRVAVVGPNGAGKSTCIKLLTGELKPTSGVVWKHQNMRLAYLAQHAFHHIENKLDLTPVQYILQRYEGGIDKEDVTKVGRETTEEEEALQKSKIEISVEGAGKEKRVIDRIVQRRKAKNNYEYLVRWQNKNAEDDTWMEREKLMALGFRAQILRIDEQEAVKLGLMRPLITSEVEKHLKNLGLDPEFATHNRMRGLSGGQKVKVVLAAATWNLPHVIVLDEPTNYLD
ncbi:translational elongation factor EF-1 alpha, partial [Perkinsus olseni]